MSPAKRLEAMRQAVAMALLFLHDGNKAGAVEKLSRALDEASCTHEGCHAARSGTGTTCRKHRPQRPPKGGMAQYQRERRKAQKGA